RFRVQRPELDAVRAGADDAADERGRYAGRRAAHGSAARRRPRDRHGALDAGCGEAGRRLSLAETTRFIIGVHDAAAGRLRRLLRLGRRDLAGKAEADMRRRQGHGLRLGRLFTIGLGSILALVVPAVAATITVGPTCTLINAIKSANSNADTGGCAH